MYPTITLFSVLYSMVKPSNYVFPHTKLDRIELNCFELKNVARTKSFVGTEWF
jgi:hypothetical protein